MRARVHIVLVAAAVTGCNCHPGPSKDDGGLPPECQVRADCDAGFICDKQFQCTGCNSTGQCALKELCSPTQELCVFRPGWGAQCQLNTDCQAGQWCVQGLCQDRGNAQLCPDGVSSECPTGMRCNTINFVCEQNLGCLAQDDCDPGEACNVGLHACVPQCTSADVSTVCVANQSCADGGYCVFCQQSSDCGVGLVCDAAGNCSTGSRCYSDRDCKIPLVCYTQSGQCVQSIPPCVSDENCAPMQRCQIGTGKCIPSTCQPDFAEPNGTPDAAYGVTQGSYDGLTLCNMETDWFSLNLTRGDQVGIDVNADPFAEQTFSTDIRDPSGIVVAYGHLVASYVATQQATYYVTVSSTDSYQTYDLNVLLSRGTPCDNDPYEPNQSPGAAYPLNATTSLDGVICPQDTDYFSLVAPAGKAATLSLVNYDSSKGLLQLCASVGGVQLGCSSDPTLPNITVPASDAGAQTVLILVEGSSSLIQNTYTLQVVLQ